MYSNPASDIFTLIVMIVIFIAIVSFCCADDKPSGSSRSSITTRSTGYSGGYSRNDYSECPACGAPYYNGYCEECGYPDINQGWLGENG